MYNMIKRDILDSYTDVVDSLFKKCNLSEKIGNIPVRVSNTDIFQGLFPELPKRVAESLN